MYIGPWQEYQLFKSRANDQTTRIAAIEARSPASERDVATANLRSRPVSAQHDPSKLSGDVHRRKLVETTNVPIGSSTSSVSAPLHHVEDQRARLDAMRRLYLSKGQAPPSNTPATPAVDHMAHAASQTPVRSLPLASPVSTPMRIGAQGGRPATSAGSATGSHQAPPAASPYMRYEPHTGTRPRTTEPSPSYTSGPTLDWMRAQTSGRQAGARAVAAHISHKYSSTGKTGAVTADISEREGRLLALLEQQAASNAALAAQVARQTRQIAEQQAMQQKLLAAVESLVHTQSPAAYLSQPSNPIPYRSPPAAAVRSTFAAATGTAPAQLVGRAGAGAGGGAVSPEKGEDPFALLQDGLQHLDDIDRELCGRSPVGGDNNDLETSGLLPASVVHDDDDHAAGHPSSQEGQQRWQRQAEAVSQMPTAPPVRAGGSEVDRVVGLLRRARLAGTGTGRGHG